MHEPIHHSVVINAPPDLVYTALTDSAQFSKMSGGAPATIGTDAGSAFSCFGGMIEGRQIELVKNQRIVQAWRVKDWPAGVYSLVRFELAPEAGGSTRIEFDHVGFPPPGREHLDTGWTTNYWDPLKKLLG